MRTTEKPVSHFARRLIASGLERVVVAGEIIVISLDVDRLIRKQASFICCRASPAHDRRRSEHNR